MHLLNKHSLVALSYFLLIALLGVFLRLFQIVELPVNYKFLVHAHSHVALLGWVYTALTTLIYKQYLVDAPIEKKYRTLFWFTQATIVGMLLTFPFTGYALFSIVFSTLFLFASYRFIWFFMRYTSQEQKRTNSYKCTHIALWYMAVSSMGPWALGIIMNTAGSGSELYRNAIYFYLHFQYNGWFVMALFGILVHILEQYETVFPKSGFRQFFWTMNTGVVATFGLSLLWMKPPIWIYWVSGLGAVMQILAMGTFIGQLFRFGKVLKKRSQKKFRVLLKIVGLLFLFKLLFQLLGAFPYWATAISSNIDLIIGYLHWTFLGVVSMALLAFLYHFGFIRLTRRSAMIYLFGFALTEGLIFYKGLVVWSKAPLVDHYFWYLAMASGVLLIAIAGIFVDQFKQVGH